MHWTSPLSLQFRVLRGESGIASLNAETNQFPFNTARADAAYSVTGWHYFTEDDNATGELSSASPQTPAQGTPSAALCCCGLGQKHHSSQTHPHLRLRSHHAAFLSSCKSYLPGQVDIVAASITSFASILCYGFQTETDLHCVRGPGGGASVSLGSANICHGDRQYLSIIGKEVDAKYYWVTFTGAVRKSL